MTNFPNSYLRLYLYRVSLYLWVKLEIFTRKIFNMEVCLKLSLLEVCLLHVISNHLQNNFIELECNYAIFIFSAFSFVRLNFLFPISHCQQKNLDYLYCTTH